jgi:hypothetical protein
MPISGLVLTLTPDDVLRGRTLDVLRSHPSVDLGEPRDDRLPIVVDSPDSDSDRRMWEWLQALPGVIQVEIAVIHFEDEPVPTRDGGED